MKKIHVIKRKHIVLCVMIIAVLYSCAAGFDKSKLKDAKNAGDKYTLLSGSMLSKAKLAKLNSGIILQTEVFNFTDKDLDKIISSNPEKIRDQMSGALIFLLEQQAVGKCLLNEAKNSMKKMGTDIKNKQDNQVIQEYIGILTEKIKATAEEARNFYIENKTMVGNAKYEEVEGQIMGYLNGMKKQQFVDNYIKDIGNRMTIAVSEDWMNKQYQAMTNNQVDRARLSGLPAMVDFGSHGCVPCDMMTPILGKLAKKYSGRVNILFVSVNDFQVLAARYGVSSIPVQVFFDARGNEVFRHTGFYPENEIEKKITEFGMTVSKRI